MNAKRLRVALIAGGISGEREISMKSGDAVERKRLTRGSMRSNATDPRDDLGLLLKNSGNTDLALILLHGRYGEDGSMQGLLDLLGISYVGSGILGSAMAMNKRIAKSVVQDGRAHHSRRRSPLQRRALFLGSDSGTPRRFHSGETCLRGIEHRSHDLSLQGGVDQRYRGRVSP